MSKATSRFTNLVLFVCGMLVVVAGCSDHTASAVAAYNNANIKRLTNLYSAYQAAHSFQGPADEAALRSFIKEQAPWRLELMQIDANKTDELFVSERDHKPFKVKYGVVSGPGAVNALVFEQEGIGGKRQVGVTGGTVEEADETKYNQMWEGRWRPSAPQLAPSNSANSQPGAAGKP